MTKSISSGTAAIGEMLTAHVSGWSPTPDEWEYQWYRNDDEIEGADDDTYTVTEADAGFALKVKVTGEKDGYTPASATSLPTDEVAASHFSATPAPTISGTAATGKTLTAEVSGWSPAPDAWQYEWYRNDTKIAGAVASTYKVVAADVGAKLKVSVTGTKSGYAQATVASAPVGPVVKGTFVNRWAPGINGYAKVGYKLYAGRGGWTPTPTKYSYQWLRNGKAIRNAIYSSYKLTRSDRGTKITVRVTAKLAGYSDASKTSKYVGPIR